MLDTVPVGRGFQAVGAGSEKVQILFEVVRRGFEVLGSSPRKLEESSNYFGEALRKLGEASR